MNRLPIPGPRPVPPMHAYGLERHKAALASGTPHMHVCNTCAQTHFPPPCACDCGSTSFRAKNLPTTGVLYAATTIHAAPGALARHAPYVVGLIDLKAGPRLLLRVLGPEGWQPECDSPVQLLVLNYDDGPVLAAYPENINITDISATGQNAEARKHLVEDGIIQLTGTITVPKERLDTFRAGLAVHKRLWKQDTGCLVFKVKPDETDPCLYHVFEQFEDRASFEAHKTRTMASDWWKITKGLDRAYDEQIIKREA